MGASGVRSTRADAYKGGVVNSGMEGKGRRLKVRGRRSGGELSSIGLLKASGGDTTASTRWRLAVTK